MHDSVVRHQRFFERRIGRAGPVTLVSRQGLILYESLISSIEHPCLPGEAIRKPSMCHDGTPVVYSLKLDEPGAQPFRLLVEPGSLRFRVSEQVAYSLTVVDQLLSRLNWQAAASDINLVTTHVFPVAAEVVDRWWGGIWLGASIPMGRESNHQAELRLYINLRHGDTNARWRRVTAVLSSLAFEPVKHDWIDEVESHSIPVGLAIVVADGRVRGLRVYVVVALESLSSLVVILTRKRGESLVAQEQLISELIHSFDQKFGLPQFVTVGLDFEKTDLDLLPTIRRTKVDFCCQLIDRNRKHEVAPWIKSQLRDWRFEAAPIEGFLSDLNAEWNGFDVEFLSVDLTSKQWHATMYVKPDVGA